MTSKTGAKAELRDLLNVFKYRDVTGRQIWTKRSLEKNKNKIK